MGAEHADQPPLTPDQVETADWLIEQCGLEGVADEQLVMEGEAGTVRYGLGRCSMFLMDLNVDQIRELVMVKLGQHPGEG